MKGRKKDTTRTNHRSDITHASALPKKINNTIAVATIIPTMTVTDIHSSYEKTWFYLELQIAIRAILFHFGTILPMNGWVNEHPGFPATWTFFI